MNAGGPTMTTSHSSTAPFLSMGRETYRVSLDGVFGANRRKLVSRLRDDGSVTGGGGISSPRRGGVAYLRGGTATERYDTDHEPIFRQESFSGTSRA